MEQKTFNLIRIPKKNDLMEDGKVREIIGDLLYDALALGDIKRTQALLKAVKYIKKSI